MSICVDITENCDTCYELTFEDCAAITVAPSNLTPGNNYRLFIVDKFQKRYNQIVTIAGDGSFTIDVAQLPNGFFNKYAGKFEIFLSTTDTGTDYDVPLVFATISYNCILAEFNITAGDVCCSKADPIVCQTLCEQIEDANAASIAACLEAATGTKLADVQALICDPCEDGVAQLNDSAGTLISNTNIPAGATVPITAPDGVVSVKNSLGVEVDSVSVKSNGTANGTAPDATAVVKDQFGNVLDTEAIPSNTSEDIIITVNEYDQDVTKLLAAATSFPSATRIGLISNYILGIKTDYSITLLSEIFDVLRLYAAHDQQFSRLNWAKRAHDATEVNSPSWIADRGYTGNATTMRLDSNYNPSTQGVRYLQNDGAIIGYCRTDLAQTGQIGGALNAAGQGTLINPRNGPGVIAGAVNRSLNTDTTSIATANSLGMTAIRRVNATQIIANKNGVDVQTVASNSVAPISLNMYELAINNNGAGAFFSSRQHCLFAVSKGNIDLSLFYSRTQTYLTALGAAV